MNIVNEQQEKLGLLKNLLTTGGIRPESQLFRRVKSDFKIYQKKKGNNYAETYVRCIVLL